MSQKEPLDELIYRYEGDYLALWIEAKSRNMLDDNESITERNFIEILTYDFILGKKGLLLYKILEDKNAIKNVKETIDELNKSLRHAEYDERTNITEKISTYYSSTLSLSHQLRSHENQYNNTKRGELIKT
ncbi:MAG: hypothetical protein KKF89_05640 [Nanoarchaeota archaeon]|nr:hypothetical protein [Nanoarchaeota archaeon]MBU1855179.1 hypothetical protein [Nanoarchaeota archaeon]